MYLSCPFRHEKTKAPRAARLVKAHGTGTVISRYIPWKEYRDRPDFSSKFLNGQKSYIALLLAYHGFLVHHAVERM